VDREEKEKLDPTKIGELEMTKINEKEIDGSMVTMCKRFTKLLETV
jgi:hypothetical protein